MCSMLSAAFAVLPESIQNEIQVFFQETEAWLAHLLQQGQDAQLWTCRPSVEQEAKGLIAMLLGAQLLARSAEDSAAAFEQVIYPLLSAKFSNS